MKKVFLILLPFFSVLALSIGVFSFFEKDLETFVLKQIEDYSVANLPFRIHADHLVIKLVAPALGLSQIQVTPKEPEKFGFQQIQINSVKANLDFLQALGGRIFISSLVVDSPQVNLNIDGFLTEDGPPPNLNWNQVFQILKKIPVFRLAVIHSRLNISSEKLKSRASFGDLDMIAFNQQNHLTIKVDLADSKISAVNQVTIPVTLRGDVVLSPEKLELDSIELSTGMSKLELDGSLTDLKNLLKDPQGKFKFQGQLDLDSIRQFFARPSKVIATEGSVHFSGKADLSQGLKYQSQFHLSGKSLKVAGFAIGDAEINGDLKDNRLRLSDLSLHHPSGDLQVRDLEAHFESANKISIRTQLESEQIDVHELLLQIGVGEVPVEFFLSGKFDCDGALLPKPDVLCKGKAHAEQIEVLAGGDSYSHSLARVEDFGATGEVRITDQAVSYQAQVSAMQDKGTSDGVINYQQGFKIHFSTPELHFNNVQNLAHLKLEGSGRIQGETSGDSQGAVFSMNMDLNQVFFEDYFLGHTQGLLKYQKGHMTFENVSGSIGSSRYSAQVGVNLLESLITAEAQAPALELSDLITAVARKATLPVDVTGFGSAFIKLHGPLQFNQLTYNLSAQAFRGFIAGESYDRIQADISAVKGEVKTDKVLIGKNKSVISVFGNGHPNGQIEVQLRGDNFLLEESENISKLSSSIAGLFNFQVGLNGHVLSPDLNFKGNLSNFIIEEQEFPSSSVAFLLNKTGLEGSANLLGNRLKSDFLLPLNSRDPFRLKATAQDWNFATLFTLIGGASLLNDYQTSLTGSIDLASESGGFFKSTGQARVDQFLLRRGNLVLTNNSPMQLNMKDGVASLSNFKLIGDTSFIDIKGSEFTADDLSISIESKVNLRLLHIFVPFMEEFGGLGKISANISGPLTRPQILGSAQAQNAFAKLKGFPHPFERINAEIQFSASKVLINSFSGNLAGGTFQGDGQIMIEGPRDLPVNIVARVENANINVPEGIKTLGDADLALSGNWFPFLLSGTYRVKSGLIDKEFGEDAGLTSSKQSSYLPKVILQSAFEPVLFDIQVQIDKGLNIKNSLVEGLLTGQMQIKGPPTQPLLFGTIQMDRNTKLKLRDQEFAVSSGSVQFKNPNEINPEFYISARSRITDYDVSLLVQGTAKAPLIRLSSTPPLSEPDLASLLALGVVTAKSDQRIKNQTAIDSQTAMAAATSALLQQGTAKKAQDKIGVNIQLSSTYDDTKNVAVQKITLSKKITEKLNASASRIQGQQNSTEYKLRYNLNNNVSTVGTYEERQPPEDAKTSETRKGENILGLDLEYKREFK